MSSSPALRTAEQGQGSTDSEPRPRRSRTWLLAGSLVVLAVQVLRCPGLLAAPRFWAEEGSEYFAYAFQWGFWPAVFARQMGYFSLVPNVACAFASLVPLALAPLVTLTVALLVQLVPSAVALSSRGAPLDVSWRRALLAVAIPLLAPSECWLTTISCQFWLAAAAALVYVCDVEPRGKVRLAYRGLLLVAGTTGVVTCFLTPLFVWKARITRDREDRVRAGILVATSALQVASVASAFAAHDPSATHRFASSAFEPLYLVLDNFVQPVLGLEVFARALPGPLETLSPELRELPPAAVLLLVLTIGAVVSMLALEFRDARGAPAAYATLVVLSTAGSIGFSGAPRYAFAPSVLLALMALHVASEGPAAWKRRWAAAVLGAILVTNLVFARSRVYFSEDLPRWPQEVERWRQDPRVPPRIWPQFPGAEWSVPLTR